MTGRRDGQLASGAGIGDPHATVSGQEMAHAVRNATPVINKRDLRERLATWFKSRRMQFNETRFSLCEMTHRSDGASELQSCVKGGSGLSAFGPTGLREERQAENVTGRRDGRLYGVRRCDRLAVRSNSVAKLRNCETARHEARSLYLGYFQ